MCVSRIELPLSKQLATSTGLNIASSGLGIHFFGKVMKPNAFALFVSLAFFVLTVSSAQAGSISGTKFEDVNGNGLRDMGIDVPFEGVTIRLLDGSGAEVATTTTDVNGEYSFTSLNPGLYVVAEDLSSLPSEVVPTTPTEISVLLVNDNGNSEITGQDFGNTILGSIHGFKFFDFNADGLYSPNDQDVPLSDVVFELTGVNQVFIDAESTNANGEFWFTGLLPGEYTVTEVGPDGYIATTPTSWTVTLLSGEEYVWADGAAMLPDGSLRREVNVGAQLMFGNTEIPVPEPASLALISLGLAGIGYRRRRQIQAA